MSSHLHHQPPFIDGSGGAKNRHLGCRRVRYAISLIALLGRQGYFCKQTENANVLARQYSRSPLAQHGGLTS